MTGHALPNGTEPTIFLDFKNGEYTVEGDIVALSDVLVENGDFGSWNPARVSAGVGLVGNNDVAPVFTGDTLALITAGSTMVAYFTGTDGWFRFELVDSSDYDTYYFSRAAFTAEAVSRIFDNSTHKDSPELADGYHKISVTMIDGKISISFDGSAVSTINPANAWSPPMAIMNMIVPPGITLESIGLYPPQVDADLPMLSDHGMPVLTAAPVITGTAQVGQTLSVSTGTWTLTPTITYQWRDGGNSAIPGATSATYLVDAADEGANLSCLVSATNAQGTTNAFVIDDDAVIAA